MISITWNLSFIINQFSVWQEYYVHGFLEKRFLRNFKWSYLLNRYPCESLVGLKRLEIVSCIKKWHKKGNHFQSFRSYAYFRMSRCGMVSNLSFGDILKTVFWETSSGHNSLTATRTNLWLVLNDWKLSPVLKNGIKKRTIFSCSEVMRISVCHGVAGYKNFSFQDNHGQNIMAKLEIAFITIYKCLFSPPPSVNVVRRGSRGQLGSCPCATQLTNID